MRVGIIGTGGMGSGFARALAGKHELVVGSRDPAGVEDLAAETGARASGHAEAADADVVILAVPYVALDETLPLLGDLSGKVVVDITNLYIGGRVQPLDEGSGAEALQERTGARVVKAFTHMYAENLTRPQAGGVPASVLIAGDEEDAKARVATLARDMGFDPFDAGPLTSAAALERLTGLLGELGFTAERALKVLSYG